MRFETSAGGIGDGALSFSDALTTNGDLGNNWMYTCTHNNAATPAGQSDNWPRATISGNQLSLFNEGTQSNNSMHPGMWFPRPLIWYQNNKPAGLWGRSQFAQITFQGAGPSNARGGIAMFGLNSDGTLSQRQSYSLQCANAAGLPQVIKVTGNGLEVGATFTTMSSGAFANWVAGDVMRLEGVISGSQLIITAKRNGTVFFTTTDAAPLAFAGLPALILQSAVGAASQTYTTFSCGPL